MADISTTLSIGAFIISLVSLYFSIRKQRFEEETAISDQESAILAKLGDLKVQGLTIHAKLATLRVNWPKCMHTSISILDAYDAACNAIDNSTDHLFFKEIKNRDGLTYRRAKQLQGYLVSLASLQSHVIAKIDEQIEISKRPCEPSDHPHPRSPSTPEVGGL